MCRPVHGTLRSQEKLSKNQLPSSLPALHQGDHSPDHGNKNGFSKRNISRMFRTPIWDVVYPRPFMPQSGEKDVRTRRDIFQVSY